MVNFYFACICLNDFRFDASVFILLDILRATNQAIGFNNRHPVKEYGIRKAAGVCVNAWVYLIHYRYLYTGSGVTVAINGSVLRV